MLPPLLKTSVAYRYGGTKSLFTYTSHATSVVVVAATCGHHCERHERVAATWPLHDIYPPQSAEDGEGVRRRAIATAISNDAMQLAPASADTPMHQEARRWCTDESALD